MQVQSWDVPNDEAAAQVEDGGVFEHNGRTWQMLAFPFVEGKKKILALRRGEKEAEHPIWHPLVFWDKASIAQNTESSRQALQSESLGQLVYVSEQLELRGWNEEARWGFHLSSNTRCHVHLLETPSSGIEFLEGRQNFGWSYQARGEWTNETDALRWWRALKRELDDGNSDVRLAMRFCVLSDIEQRDFVWRWRRGNYDEAETALRCAFLGQKDWGENNMSGCWDVCLPLREDDRFGLWRSQDGHIQNLTFTSEFQLNVEIINSYFAPHIDSDLLARSECVQDWSYGGDAGLSFSLHFDSPSHHERLEAALRFREWREKHGV